MLPMIKNRWADPFQSHNFYPADTTWTVSEDDQSIHLELDLPGYRKDEVKVSVDRDLLIVEGKTQVEEGSSRREREVTRRLRLADSYRGAEVDARLEDGVLFLTVHKPEAVKLRSIQVK